MGIGRSEVCWGGNSSGFDGAVGGLQLFRNGRNGWVGLAHGGEARIPLRLLGGLDFRDFIHNRPDRPVLLVLGRRKNRVRDPFDFANILYFVGIPLFEGVVVFVIFNGPGANRGRRGGVVCILCESDECRDGAGQ
jgi:hypothetical protein